MHSLIMQQLRLLQYHEDFCLVLNQIHQLRVFEGPRDKTIENLCLLNRSCMNTQS